MELIAFLINRKPPLHLLTLDALIPRLSPSHPKLSILRVQAAKYQKGYNGERKLDYYLKSLPDSFDVLNDIKLQMFNKTFQIDSLLITAHGIYIVEVKSFEGIVTFDTTLKQLLQENGERLQGLKYPITQVENIQFHLIRWLQQRNLEGIPIYYLIAFSERSTIIKVNGEEQQLKDIVTYVDEIPLLLINMNKRLSRSYPGNPSLKKRIMNSIMKNQVVFKKDIIRDFKIKEADILPGVQCSKCLKLGMIRLRYKWQCPTCGNLSVNAHVKALLDFTLLFGNEITNQQCRRFLKIPRSTAYSILKKLNFPLHKANRTWILDINKLR